MNFCGTRLRSEIQDIKMVPEILFQLIREIRMPQNKVSRPKQEIKIP